MRKSMAQIQDLLVNVRTNGYKIKYIYKKIKSIIEIETCFKKQRK